MKNDFEKAREVLENLIIQHNYKLKKILSNFLRDIGICFIVFFIVINKFPSNK